MDQPAYPVTLACACAFAFFEHNREQTVRFSFFFSGHDSVADGWQKHVDRRHALVTKGIVITGEEQETGKWDKIPPFFSSFLCYFFFTSSQYGFPAVSVDGH